MKCPYCGGEMKSGKLEGDGRSRLRWFADGEKPGCFDRLLSNVGIVSRAEYDLCSVCVPSHYCTACKKMIIETEIEK